MIKNYSYIVVNFFKVSNPYSGASEVSYHFFKNIPSKDKKLFQFSNITKNKKNIYSLKAISKIQKIFKIKKLAELIIDYCKNKRKPVIFIEGASWIGYTFIIYQYLKKKLPQAKFIYHSHNVEYLLRKQRNNLIIALLTRYFENYISKKFNVFTCVSKKDQNKLQKLYNFKSKIFFNGVDLPNIKKVKDHKVNFKYIFFCGSVDYIYNKEALEILVKEILPRLTKQNSNIKLLVSGSKKIPFNDKNLINVGFVKKNKFYELMKGASLFVNTMKTGYGSQLKTITALSFGKTIIATNKE